MYRFFVKALIFLFVLLQSYALTKRAASETEREEGSPQFLYMERLRKLTHDKAVTGLATDRNNNEPNSQAPGTLLATSFKDSNVGSGRFDVSTDVDPVKLQFTVPRQQDSGDIVKSELWLFPTLESTQDDGWYEIRLTLFAKMKYLNKEREFETNERIYWRSSDKCVMVVATDLTKKIARRLKRHGINETLIDLTLEIIMIRPLINAPKEAEWQQTCRALSPRSSNNSFLVIKYYSDQESTSTTGRKKRSTVPTTTSESPSSCSLVPFRVNLTEVFGSWIISPRELVDIKDCKGTCDVVSDYKLFSPRAVLKDRLKDSIKYEQKVSCVPTAFEPVAFLIYQEDYYVLVEYLVSATACGCR